MTITLARAQLPDLEDVVQLFNAYRLFYEQTSDVDGARAFLRERLQNKDSVIFLAKQERDGPSTPVGFTQLYPLFSSVGMQRIWLLNDLFVAEEARRHGAARLLMEKARQFAEQTGALRVELATAKDNWPAKTLYESLGYVLDEAFDRYVLILQLKDEG